MSSIAATAQEDDVLQLQQLDEHVYAVVGPFGNRSAENLGNNATFGFVVTGEGVVVIDAGGSYKGAAAIDAQIRKVTDKPLKAVINTGGQDHRWLGNGFFKERGAQIIASEATVTDHRQRLQDQMFALGNLVGNEGMAGTEAVYADKLFSERTSFTLGGTTFELIHAGPAHTPGDTLVWLPKERIVFSGDIVYTGRMLGVMPYSNSRHWIEAFNTMAALEPEQIVPGHGPVITLERARSDTLDYLSFLRDAVGSFMDEGGSITEIGKINQSPFSYLVDYEILKGRNAQQVYQEMEWE
ncbi:MAG: MBL fold metallo-hydrolase [Gammaproteobacteria bacterium]|nr:MBL fold metallo-hydrolase [Gammaproteobacteria bacterium]